VTTGREAIAANVAAVRARIAAAATRAGRDPADVTLVAAAKTVPPEVLADVVEAGVLDLGENRAQELLAKAPELAGGPVTPRWHFIGALQRNKVRALARWVDRWHSVDRVSLGETIARHVPGARDFVEVNDADEPSKAGCARAAAAPLVDALRALDLAVDGLMAVPPEADDPRRWFALLAEMAVALELRDLSMGMSHDYEVAVEEGATFVRVGRALFGPRPT
jgi:pyridoxal phosphate enzyme (YggS family)